jgi:hypothetical protein
MGVSFSTPPAYFEQYTTTSFEVTSDIIHFTRFVVRVMQRLPPTRSPGHMQVWSAPAWSRLCWTIAAYISLLESKEQSAALAEVADSNPIATTIKRMIPPKSPTRHRATFHGGSMARGTSSTAAMKRIGRIPEQFFHGSPSPRNQCWGVGDTEVYFDIFLGSGAGLLALAFVFMLIKAMRWQPPE